MRFHFDYETFMIVPGLQAPPPVCMSFAWGRDSPTLVHARGRILWQQLEEALRDKAVLLIAHNAAFEVLVTMAARPEWTPLIFQALREGRIRCTRVREKLIRVARGDHERGFALDDLTEAYSLPMVDKGFHGRTRYGLLWGTPICDWPQEYIDYALGDIAVREIYDEQEKVDPQWLADQGPRMRARVSLSLTSAWGFPTDRKLAKKLYESTKVKLEGYKDEILAAGLARYESKPEGIKVVTTVKAATERILAAYEADGREAPRNEPTEAQLRKIYKEHDEVPRPGATVQGMLKELEENGIFPEGSVSLNEEACQLSGDPLMMAYSYYKQSATLMSKFARLTRTPIQCFYNELVSTGRTSSTQGDDPGPGEPWSAYGMQVQNLPRVGAEVDE